MKYDLSIIVPGIRQNLFQRVYDSAVDLCKAHTWEMIFVGPNYPDVSIYKNNNVKYIYDRGTPTRCLDLGIHIAEGENVTYTSDDTLGAISGSLDRCIDILNENPESIMCLQYNEHPGFTRIPFDMDYWRGHHHAALRLPNIDTSWLMCIIFMIKKSLYNDIGFDTRFEHINMNLADLAFRHQKFGGDIIISPDLVWMADFVHRDKSDPVIAAFFENDLPLFEQTWGGDRQRVVDTTWRDCENVWSRRR